MATHPSGRKNVMARRNELARERGFKSYADQRKQFTKAQGARTFRAGAPEGIPLKGGRMQLRVDKNAALVKQWDEAFYGPDRDDYSVNSPKARWFIDVLEQYTAEEWAERYPNGVREYGMGMAA